MEKRTLGNGLCVYLDHRPLRESAAQLFIGAGSAHDSKIETAHLLEHLQGAACRVYGDSGPLSYADANAKTMLEKSCYYFNCLLPDNLPLALGYLSVVLSPPDTALFEREREAVLHELSPYNEPYTLLRERVFNTLFPNHGKIMPGIRMRLNALPQLSAQDCLDYWQRYYTPANATLYLGGEFPDDIQDLLIPFQKIPERPAHATRFVWPEEKTLESRIELQERIRQNSTASIYLSYQATAFPKSQSIVGLIATHMLAVYLNATYGVLYRVLRDEQKLCYGLKVDHGREGDAVQFTIGVATAQPTSCAAIEQHVIGALRTLAQKGIPDSVVDILKKNERIENIHRDSIFDVEGMLAEIDFGLTRADEEAALRQVTGADIASVALALADSPFVVSIALPQE